VLTLSWSPAFCAQHGKQSPEQCDKPHGYGFVVHGLWPQYDPKGWPQHCAQRGEVDDAIGDQMLAIMPSRKLMEHEWEAHGTCSGLGPADYFALIRSARAKIHVPPALVEPKKPVSASADDIQKMFIDDNPGLGREMMAVMCKKLVNEVRFCLDQNLAFRKCGTDVKTQCKGKAIFSPVR
jgi:ribonuclease T2